MKTKQMFCLLLTGFIVPAAALAQLPTPTYGWNMGNTLEPPCGEGCWGPAATEALINAVADAGFNTVRIPCAWDSHANQTTYVIDPVYMARVKQVVDWCLARNLYVIINCHWDNGWLENNITDTVDPTINAKQHSYWTQIANAFINYDDRLLFAGCNEPNADTAAEMATLLVYEQTFVNAVRATGGSNTIRWLVVQGPNTDIDLTYNLMNTLPTDPTPGRLMVEVHYYSPYNFVMMTKDETWGNQFFYWGQGYHSSTDTAHNPTWGEEDYMEAQFQKMKTKFVNLGIPVIVGEFGAMKRTSQLSGDDLDLHLRSRTYYHKTVVDTANSKGLKPMFWNIQGGLFNWTTGAEVDPDNINALTGGPALPPPGSDTTPPSAPTGLTAGPDGINAALDWEDNPEADLWGYNVYRSTTSGTGFSKLNSLLIVDSEYTDTSTARNQTYYYIIKAVDTSLNESVASGEQAVTIPATALGTILREWWTGISGTAVSNLTSNANYPNNPSGREQIRLLEGPVNWADNYGTRIRGYVYPPTTGSYTFWIAGDDNCQLWLSTDGSPVNKSRIAYISGSGWTDSRQWDKYGSQQSSPRTLTAGQKYYIEILHKENTGGDNIAVAWSGPGIAQEVIAGRYLSPWPIGLYGDSDEDGMVEADDLAELAALWLDNDCASTAGIDRDGDCVVDLVEFAAFAQNWLSDGF
jgi:aryl-phospho-beta-D-glucosidase BglC (GH1 family)